MSNIAGQGLERPPDPQRLDAAWAVYWQPTRPLNESFIRELLVSPRACTNDK